MDPGRRYSHHLGGKTGLKHAVAAHGRSAFAFEIVREFSSKSEALRAELELIERLDAYNPAKGFNLRPTGGAGEGNENARANTVYQYRLDGTLVASYRSEKEASEKTGIARAQIGKCCRIGPPTYATAGGFRWSHL